MLFHNFLPNRLTLTVDLRTALQNDFSKTEANALLYDQVWRGLLVNQEHDLLRVNALEDFSANISLPSNASRLQGTILLVQFLLYHFPHDENLALLDDHQSFHRCHVPNHRIDLEEPLGVTRNLLGY
ncbi:MAG TPA: hypothetical protein DF383_11940 [Deltaproteobacteria bacterium]|nr:hypothetical protein [Deltaproteobacteria bacterium]